MKRKITLLNARKISQAFCNDMIIPYCEIYYVDILPDALGIYISTIPAHILMLNNADYKIALLMHELIHHLDFCNYNYRPNDELTHSTKGYILAKKRVITWCKNNISRKPNWNTALKAYNYDEEMKKIRL